MFISPSGTTINVFVVSSPICALRWTQPQHVHRRANLSSSISTRPLAAAGVSEGTDRNPLKPVYDSPPGRQRDAFVSSRRRPAEDAKAVSVVRCSPYDRE
jgi:hypothetical protein